MMVWSTPWKALRFRLECGGRNAVIYEWKNNCFGWPSPLGKPIDPVGIVANGVRTVRQKDRLAGIRRPP